MFRHSFVVNKPAESHYQHKMAYKTKRTTKTTENTQWCENQTSARPHCAIDTAVNAWKHGEASILQIIAYKYDFD